MNDSIAGSYLGHTYTKQMGIKPLKTSDFVRLLCKHKQYLIHYHEYHKYQASLSKVASPEMLGKSF
jgi:hypothetical protein